MLDREEHGAQTCCGLRYSFCCHLMICDTSFVSPAQLSHNKEPSVGAFKVLREYKIKYTVVFNFYCSVVSQKALDRKLAVLRACKLIRNCRGENKGHFNLCLFFKAHGVVFCGLIRFKRRGNKQM